MYVAGQDRQVFVYRVDLGVGERDVVSSLEADWVFRHGLHPEAIMATIREGADPDDLTPADVEENGTFLRLLSRVILDNITACAGIRREAEIQGNGSVYLLDGRTPDPGGRVPPEDIIGAVAVSNGEPATASYRHNPRHRLFTTTGWFRLPGELEAALQRRLRAD